MRNQELVFAMRLAIPCNMAGISFYSILVAFYFVTNLRMNLQKPKLFLKLFWLPHDLPNYLNCAFLPNRYSIYLVCYSNPLVHFFYPSNSLRIMSGLESASTSERKV
jgi:hypothetical protein